MNLITLLIIGDILVCAFLAGLVAWLFTRADDAKMDAAARIPLEDDAPAAASSSAATTARRP